MGPVIAPDPPAARRRFDLAALTLGSAIVTAGLSAGVFFAYSSSVMIALNRSDDRTFVTVMQQINEAIQNPVFFLVLFGAPLFTAVAAVQQRRRGNRAAAKAAAWALGLCVLGLVITSAANVPLNDQLAAAGAPSRIPDVHAVRQRFEAPWDAWNVLRTIVYVGVVVALARAAISFNQSPPEHRGEAGVTAVAAASSPAAILPGQALENPVTGERFTFTDTAATTDGELLGFDFQLRPGGAVPIAHVHPFQTERFEVIEGRMRFRTGMHTRTAGPGDVVEIPPGVTHSFANTGDTEARLHVEVRPALAMEQMLADVVDLATAGRLTRRGIPRSPRDLATLACRYDHEAHAPLIGLTMQRLLLTRLAR